MYASHRIAYHFTFRRFGLHFSRYLKDRCMVIYVRTLLRSLDLPYNNSLSWLSFLRKVSCLVNPWS